MEKYTVLLSREVPVSVSAVAAPLADILGVPTIEVTRELRRSPWVLLRDVPAILLDDVFDTLSAANVPAKAVPDAWLPRLPPALAVRIADPLPKGLFLQAAEPPAPPVLPWTDLDLVSMGLVTISGEEHYLIDLLTDEEYSLRLRIDGIDFSHEWLGARMASSTRENLKRFLIDVHERAPDARLTGKTMGFLSGELTATFRFPSVEGFEDYTQWTLEALMEEEEDEEEAGTS
jgi:hypothetical protein